MSSESRGIPTDAGAGHIERIGDGWAVTAPHLYVWEESLVEARGWGAALGVLPRTPPAGPRSDHGGGGGSRLRAAS